MTYIELKEFIKDKNISNVKEWRGWVKNYPSIHPRPERKYKEEFEGYIIFLNLNKVKRKTYWGFEECVQFLAPYKFTTKQFYKFLKDNKDIAIPTRPQSIFKSQFTSFTHFLSNDNISVKKNKYYSYDESINFLKDKNLKTVKTFRKEKKDNKWIFIPSNPEKYYKQFISYHIFLSNNSISNKEKNYLSYSQAKICLMDKGIKSIKQYHNFIIENNITFLPKNPRGYYKKEYVSNSDYLSNLTKSPNKLHDEYNILYLKKFIKDNNIESYKEYKCFLKKHNISNLPSNPCSALKNRGFISNEDLFGRNLKQSSGEKIIEKYLKENGFIYDKQFKFKKCKNKKELPFDFYLKNINTCIEYDGRQHYKSISLFGGDDGLEKRRNNDIIKNNYCINNSINLIRIRYNENIIEKLNEFLPKK